MGETKSRMRQISVFVTQQQHTALTRISGDTGIPQAVLIRKGIDRVLMEYARRRGRG